MNNDVNGQDRPDGEEPKRSRRQLLTLAGAAAVGGTAIALGQAGPAGAANGDPFTLGATNEATLSTTLNASASSVQALIIDNDSGPGIDARGTNAPDLKATGTGRFAQRAFGAGNAEPSHGIVDLDTFGAPVVPAHEIVRGTNGSIWASTGGGTGGSTAWKRINAVRVDNPNGSGGAFAPFRLLDSRNGNASAITRNSPLDSGTTYTFDVDAVSQLPTGTIGIIGNITVINQTYTGFVTLWPGGTVPTVANLNFSPGGIFGNFFQVGLDSSGRLRVRPGNAPGSVDVIIDVFGYMQ